jgi:hypothetical protein
MQIDRYEHGRTPSGALGVFYVNYEAPTVSAEETRLAGLREALRLVDIEREKQQAIFNAVPLTTYENRPNPIYETDLYSSEGANNWGYGGFDNGP